MNIRILHVLISPKAEGTPRLVLDWLNYKKFDQGVILLNETPNDLINQFEKSCAFLFRFNVGKTGYNKFFKTNSIVKEVVKTFNADLVIAWPQSLGSAIIWGLRTSKTKSLLHIGCYPKYDSLFQILYNYFVYLPVLVNKGKIVCASSFLYKRLLVLPGIPKSKVLTIHNSVKIDRFLPYIKSNPTKYRKGAILVSNLESFKNQLFLLTIWSKLIERGYEFELTLVGGGSMRSELESSVARFGLEKFVHFTGPVGNVPYLLGQNKLFLFPTDFSEGFGTVLIEALAAGCIVIANNVPSCNEVLENGKWGYLIPFLDEEKYIEKVIQEMENEQYNYDIDDLYKYLQNYETENMMNRYLEFSEIDK